jgi:hypothetical protein
MWSYDSNEYEMEQTAYCVPSTEHRPDDQFNTVRSTGNAARLEKTVKACADF